ERDRVVDTELGAQVGDRALEPAATPLVPGVLRLEVLVEPPHRLPVALLDRLPALQFRPPVAFRAVEDVDRVVGLLPLIGVDHRPHGPADVVPRPPEVVGEIDHPLEGSGHGILDVVQDRDVGQQGNCSMVGTPRIGPRGAVTGADGRPSPSRPPRSTPRTLPKAPPRQRPERCSGRWASATRTSPNRRWEWYRPATR